MFCALKPFCLTLLTSATLSQTHQGEFNISGLFSLRSCRLTFVDGIGLSDDFQVQYEMTAKGRLVALKLAS